MEKEKAWVFRGLGSSSLPGGAAVDSASAVLGIAAAAVGATADLGREVNWIGSRLSRLPSREGEEELLVSSSLGGFMAAAAATAGKLSESLERSSKLF